MSLNIDSMPIDTGDNKLLIDIIDSNSRLQTLPCTLLLSVWAAGPIDPALKVNVSTLAYGMAIGWMSPMTLLLQSDRTPAVKPLTEYEISWMASSGYLMSIPATFISAIIQERFGRKAGVICMSASLVACWILKLSSVEIWALVLARVLVGYAMGSAYVVCPVYTKEISEDSVRGALGSLVVLSQTTGNLLMFILGGFLSYRATLWTCLALPTLHLALFLLMPESPSHLVKHGQYEEAVRTVAWLRCRTEEDQLVQAEVEGIRKEQQKDDEDSKFAFKAMIKDKILFRAFRVALMVTLAREVCGANPVLNFAGYIFDLASNGTQGSGLILSPNQQAMVLGVVQVAGSIIASTFVERAGRKRLLLLSSLFSGLGMSLLASWFLTRLYELDWPGWIPILALCLCIFCDASGLQPISIVVMNEIFSYKYRSTVSAVTMAIASIADFIQLLFFRPVASALGIHVCFYFFGAFCLCNTVYVLTSVPETKLRSLDQIYEDLKTKKEKAADEVTLKRIGD